MRTHNNEPLYIFKDVLSTGIDLLPEGTIFAILEGNNFALYEHRTNSAAVVATTTIADYLAIVPELYDELPLSDGLRTTYVTKQDMIDEPITKDFQLAKCQDTDEIFVFTLEPIDANAPIDWIRDTSNTGYFKPEANLKKLRLNTVKDVAELKTLVAENNSKTTVTDTDETYVYRLVATPQTGIVSDDGLGEWLLASEKTYILSASIDGQTDFDFSPVHSEPLDLKFLDVYINGAYQNDSSLYLLVAPLNKTIKFSEGMSRKTEVRIVVKSRLN